MCPLSRAEDNVIRIILKCSEMQRRQEQLLLRKSLNLNKDTSVRKIVRSAKITELRKLGTIFSKSKCK